MEIAYFVCSHTETTNFWVICVPDTCEQSFNASRSVQMFEKFFERTTPELRTRVDGAYFTFIFFRPRKLRRRVDHDTSACTPRGFA